MIVLLLCLFLAAYVRADEDIGLQSRKAKLFYVSTNEVTSTITTATVCFVSSTTMAACGKRKKRASLDVEILDDKQEIAPSSLESSIVEEDGVFDREHRDPKFLVYWLTTTSTYTSYTYTTTATVGSVNCTPSNGWTLNEC